MATYRFRVTFEEHDDVTRDIEIRATQTFDDLHHAIHNSIGFDASKPSSFYMSDDNWKKGKEITTKDVSEGDEGMVSQVKTARLCNFIIDPHQKIYYVFDFDNPWTFFIELIKINREEDPGASYPRCVKAIGEAPKQFGQATIAAIPIPEEFDLDLEDLEDEEEPETVTLGVEAEDLPEGEEKEEGFVAEDEGEGEDFETAGEDLLGDGNEEI
jgi:hypothetical protein